MSKRKPRNATASVRQQLANLASKLGEDFQFVMTRYVIERLLYRLSQSQERAKFVLKGAVLFQIWTGQPHRPTRDLDLLGKGSPSTERLIEVFQNICLLAVEDDGLTFDPKRITAERIKQEQEYGGVRVHCEARLGQARIELQIDVGFGDAVTPRAIKVPFPTLLAFPVPVLRAYRRETMVAEKFQAMVALGIANSRMKDFYDIWTLARSFPFDGVPLSQAVQATFLRRKTMLPEITPIALTIEFGSDSAKVKQWQAFISRSKLNSQSTPLDQVCALLEGFLMPPVRALIHEHSFSNRWLPLGPWSQEIGVDDA